jgi:AcrR family transcriptional regulator
MMIEKVAAPQPFTAVRRGQRTRLALEDAALGLFSTRGTDAVTIDDIVREAAVAKGSFYTHFADKNALIVNLISAIRSDVEPRVAVANDGLDDYALRLARGLAVYVRFALDEPKRALMLTIADDSQMSASAALNRGLLNDLRRGLASARFAFPTVESAMMFVSGVVRPLIIATARGGERALATGKAQNVATMMLRGLGVAWRDAERLAAWAIEDVVRDPAPLSEKGLS